MVFVCLRPIVLSCDGVLNFHDELSIPAVRAILKVFGPLLGNWGSGDGEPCKNKGNQFPRKLNFEGSDTELKN